MTQKIANILTIGLWKRPQRWWRAHPKFTIMFVMVEAAACYVYLKKKYPAPEIDLNLWQNDMSVIEAEIAADPVGWYIKNGLTPYSHEEKDAFRDRYPQFKDYTDAGVDAMFIDRKVGYWMPNA